MALFKARARALDMLGRQQIAGIPTAINELFKNAHDAYARRVMADFYRPEQLFVLRDNGLGMTEDDFVERWLTLGTESKLGAAHGIALPPPDPTQSKRPVMGEKGIGRLAIASLGPQVLVLTRAKRDDKLDDLVAAFINWEVFESPGIDLNEIEIPVRTFAGGTLPTSKDVLSLVNATRKNVKRLQPRMESKAALRILQNLEHFNVDPARFFEHDFTLADDGHGTAFLIRPVDESLESELRETDMTAASPLVKTLIGFSNTLYRRNKIDFTPEFRDHRTADDVVEVIGTSEFFTPEDFDAADHRIVGKFDRYGKFTGTVSVYDDEPKDYELPWAGNLGKEAACGPFKFQFAYIQGELKSTRLTPDEHARLTQKLDRIGGLYIYKDGIRVLPYGNSDVDFLDVERRRSQNAAHYFFSYRRMFGAIEISRSMNPELQEKAGREGFRANKAYRDFKEILASFLVQLAADFFRQGGVRAKAWERRKDDLKRNAAARKERDRQAEAARAAFQAQMADALARFDAKAPQREVRRLLQQIRERLSVATRQRQGAAEAVLEAEAIARRELDELRATYTLKRPRGYALPRRQAEEWDAYQEMFDAFDEKVFSPCSQEIERITAEAVQTARLSLSRRKRAERSLHDGIRSARDKAKPLADEVTKLAASVQADAIDKVQKALSKVEATIADALDRFAQLPESGDTRAFEQRRNEILQTIESAALKQATALEHVRDQLKQAIRSGAGALLTEALEEELLALREQAELDLGLTQLGMAVEIINHEFTASIKGVRTSLRRLKAWADRNAQLRDVYNSLRTSFDHLDGYLTLFTPLQRRLTRRAVEMKGNEIAQYLNDLFSERLARHDIALDATDRFNKLTIRGYPSTFYPVLVNLVDNALHWLSDRPKPRQVQLDADGDQIFVRDSGPGIPERDRDRAFELGFTRKTGGRGLGLYISRAVLGKEGYSLSLLATPSQRPWTGATFVIAPK